MRSPEQAGFVRPPFATEPLRYALGGLRDDPLRDLPVMSHEEQSSGGAPLPIGLPPEVRQRLLGTDPPSAAGRHILALAMREPTREQRHSWATDAWADAVYDIVRPEGAEGLDQIGEGLIVFEDASCLLYTPAEPREVSLAEGLGLMGRLDRRTVARLLRSPSALVRAATLGAVEGLRPPRGDCTNGGWGVCNGDGWNWPRHRSSHILVTHLDTNKLMP
jgi:hypothetical protein